MHRANEAGASNDPVPPAAVFVGYDVLKHLVYTALSGLIRPPCHVRRQTYIIHIHDTAERMRLGERLSAVHIRAESGDTPFQDRFRQRLLIGDGTSRNIHKYTVFLEFLI